MGAAAGRELNRWNQARLFFPRAGKGFAACSGVTLEAKNAFGRKVDDA